jgi:nicotinamidase-related amidase
MRTAKYATTKTLDGKTAKWLAEVRGSVAARPGLVLEPGRCALLVVDMLRYFAHPEGRCFLPAAEPIIPGIRALLDSWRGFGGTVAFTRHCHAGGDDLGMLGRFFSDYVRKGEPDAELVDELAPRDGEPVFEKTTYDAFLGTGLEAFLRGRGAEQVLVAGVLTHMCVETTARAAFCRGFQVYVPADGTASSCEERHLQSLKAMADAVAVVTRVGEILAT